jgi:predicted NBD/HSP70 family sugar kinase
MDTRIGIDLGGNKIEAIALDDEGATLYRHRIPTPVGDYTGTLDAIAGWYVRSSVNLTDQAPSALAHRVHCRLEPV